MVTIVQKGDLSSDFTNDNTNNAGGIGVRSASATQRGIVDLVAEQQLGDGNKVIGGNIKAQNFLGVVDTGTGLTLDAQIAEAFVRTISAPTTFVFTAAAGRVSTFILELIDGGSAAVTWPAGTKWAEGTPPTLTVSGTDLLGFYNRGAGWHGVVLSLDSK